MVGYLYKIISMVLANRLKGMLPILVGETQYGFVEKRKILNGAFIANEVV